MNQSKNKTAETMMEDDDNIEPIDTGSFPSPSPGRCIYGYVLFLVSLVALILYYLWAFVPTSLIQATGITYMPSKYWAICLPIFVMMLITLFALFLYPAVNLLLTPPLDHCSTVFDCKFTKCNLKATYKGIPPVSDLPLDYVSQQLYLTKVKM